MSAVVTPKMTLPELAASPPDTGKPALSSSLLKGMSALGVSLGLERAAVFLSSVLAARLGGAEAFGAYSLALTTANNVASYAGAGIGITSNRFVGDHPPGSAGYLGLLRVLATVSVVSSALAMLVLWLGAEPLANSLLKNGKLAGPLKVAAISAGAFILLECCRGLLIGQRSYTTLLVLSVLVGGGMLLVLPVAAPYGALPMLAGQSAAVLLAVLVACWLIWRTALTRPHLAGDDSPSVWQVWRFGSVQLIGVIGLNAAGWWVATLVARYDQSLVHMAFYAISNQLRNMSALVPGLVWQTSFSMLTKNGGKDFGGSERVLTVTTFVASMLAAAFAGVVIGLLPWMLELLYGATYKGTELAASLAVATALVHMGSAPASARLMAVSLRHTGFVNLAWAVFVAGMGTWLVPGRGVTAAVATFLGAHALSMGLVLICLRKAGELPRGVVGASFLNLILAFLLLCLAYGRIEAWISPWSAAASCAAVAGAGVLLLWRAGQFHGLVRPRLNWSSLLALAGRTR